MQDWQSVYICYVLHAGLAVNAHMFLFVLHAGWAHMFQYVLHAGWAVNAHTKLCLRHILTQRCK